ncbi:hypothetical protein L3X38_017602 [Prunus dulcis]|uniref:Uncharacterized protein n=1 Tax=Prunus dulcis TaxID=3755 RepID=A0AAD4ZA73_PRUDU|nr:hypothetical protein L3X38_017602 [Prunus dulcis]
MLTYESAGNKRVTIRLPKGKRSESRPLDTNLERKNMTSILLRLLFQRSKEHKLRFQEDDAVVVGSPYHTMRRSPGGPDPAHH